VKQNALFPVSTGRRRPVDVRIELGVNGNTAWVWSANPRARKLVRGHLSIRQFDHVRRCWMLPGKHVDPLQRALQDFGLTVSVVRVKR
jgi:hypothetical protein